MSTDPLSFLDGDSSEDALSFLDQPKESKIRTALKKRGKSAAQYGIGAAQVAATPYELAVMPLASKEAQQVPYRENMFSDIERLQEQKASGNWDQQDQELYDSLIDQIKNPGKAEKHIKTADIGVGNLIEKGAEKVGVDLKPQGFEQHAARIAGNIVSPGALAKGVAKLPSLLTKEGRQAAKLASQWKNLTRAAKGNPEKEGMLSFAKAKNLTPEEATLLTNSKWKVDYLSKIAKKSGRFKKTAEGLKSKLGGNYEELKQVGREGGLLGEKSLGKLSDDLSTVLNDMSKTFVEGPDTKGAREAIEKALFSIENQGGTLEHLINSRPNLKQSANWNKVDAKGALLKKADDAIFKAIERQSPEVAKDLKATDLAYSKYKNYEKILNKKQPKISYKGIEVPNLLSAIAFFSVIGAPKTVTAYVGKELIQRIASRMVTDPRLQGLRKRLISAIQSGATDQQREIFNATKNILRKEDPNLYSEIADLNVE